MLFLSLKDRKPANKNRSSLDIVREILSIALVKVCKTRIMYGANLSFLQLEKYLSALLGNALLSFDGDSGYLTTASGKEFLQLYADYLERSTRLRAKLRGTQKTDSTLKTCADLEKTIPRITKNFLLSCFLQK